MQKYEFNEKDKYETRQIYNFASENKKLYIIQNFDSIALKVLKIKQELKQTQEILLWRAISNIERSIKTAKIWWTKKYTWDSINKLKNIL